MLPQLIKLRHNLHQHAELSGCESRTAQILIDYFKQFEGVEVYTNLGGHGLAFIFSSKLPGPHVVFRCELDALPMIGKKDLSYSSLNKNVNHQCGHDGHMAIMAGLAHALKHNPIIKGKVMLLFQPAEENGVGAKLIMNDKRFRDFAASQIYALHNFSEYPLGSVIVRDEYFCGASQGIIVELFGKTSHAAWPKNGNSPALAVSDLLKEFSELNLAKNELGQYAFATTVYSCMGKKSFGISPSKAEIHVTIRAQNDQLMQKVLDQVESHVAKATEKYLLKSKISYQEHFISCYNHPQCGLKVKRSAEDNNFPLIEVPETLRASEDFGQYTKLIPGYLFCLGAGKSWPQVHTEHYDFPDQLIPIGLKLWAGVTRQNHYEQ
ncbi:hypothetical protein BVY03_00120 [bacterium K02(2017)]|nr:hypothetical protein BVY03_00120 [bacterium K02(2017)]